MHSLRPTSARRHAGQVWPAPFVVAAQWLLMGGLLALASLRAAGAEANPGVGISYRVRGEGVELVRDGGGEGVGQVSPSISLSRWEPGQRFRTGAHGSIVLRLEGVGWVIIAENTEAELSEFQPAARDGSTSGRVVLRLERGWLFARKAGREYVLEVTFGDGAMGVREAAVFGLSANGRLSLYEGRSVLVMRASASGPQGVSVIAPQTFEPGVGLRPLSREEKEAPEWRLIEGSSQPMAAPPRPEAPWPKFPWPPPEASGRVQIPDAFVREDEPSTLGDVASRFEGALTEAEYAQWSYFAAPWGFVLVTCLEQVEEDGTPKEGEARWAIEPGELKRFTLKSYLKALFKADPGHFRVVAIVVTTDSFATSGTRPGRDEAVKWLSKGVNRLPSEIAQRLYTAAHACTALVYEFEKPVGKQRPVTVVPGRLPARRHLERAGVWNGLERRGRGL